MSNLNNPESVCQQLTDAFVACGEAFAAFNETAIDVRARIIARQIEAKQLVVAEYSVKALEGSFLKRWYWRRKLKNAQKSYNQLIKRYTHE